MNTERTILLADDSEDDVLLLELSFKKAGLVNPFVRVKNGAEAIAYLRGDPPFDDRDKYPKPTILLLDLKMPVKDGFEVLKWLRSKYRNRGLLVVVLSRLEEIKSINRAYELGANSYLAKPADAKELQNLIKTFHGYWIKTNKHPKYPGETILL
jgi:CheY-like chemotaxis protein